MDPAGDASSFAAILLNLKLITFFDGSPDDSLEILCPESCCSAVKGVQFLYLGFFCRGIYLCIICA